MPENLIERFARDYPAGEVLFREGDRGQQMFVVQAGSVEIRRRVGDSERIVAVVPPGEFFGEMALIDERPRSATAVALRRSNLLAVDGPTFEAMILTNGKFALKIIKVLSERIRRSNEQVSDLIETMPRERIARGLVDFAGNHGERIHDGATTIDAAAATAWINGHLGVPRPEIEAAIARFIRLESIAWAPTSVKTHERLVLPESFIQANDRRTGD